MFHIYYILLPYKSIKGYFLYIYKKNTYFMVVLSAKQGTPAIKVKLNATEIKIYR